jgi:hypothetical protein
MSGDEALKLEALKLALKVSGDQYEDIYVDVLPLAEAFYKFLKG